MRRWLLRLTIKISAFLRLTVHFFPLRLTEIFKKLICTVLKPPYKAAFTRHINFGHSTPAFWYSDGTHDTQHLHGKIVSNVLHFHFLNGTLNMCVGQFSFGNFPPPDPLRGQALRLKLSLWLLTTKDRSKLRSHGLTNFPQFFRHLEPTNDVMFVGLKAAAHVRLKFGKQARFWRTETTSRGGFCPPKFLARRPTQCASHDNN